MKKEKEISQNPVSVPIHKHRMGVLLIGIAVIAVIAGGYSVYQLQRIKKDPQAVTKRDRDALVAKVSRLFVLPAGEDPTIATVSDPGALSNQEFFAQALKDDKVLIYANAKKAILYRPSIDKIINIAPVNNGDTGTTAQKSISEQPKPATSTKK